MRILLSSHRFHPDVGGIETASLLFAQSWSRAGHQVVVVTQTPGTEADDLPFQVVRQPGPWTLLKLVWACDVFFHNHLSLQTAWPLVVLRRPWVVTLQTWLPRGGLLAWLKRWSLRFARRLYISEAIARDAELPGSWVGNPMDETVFGTVSNVVRDRDLVFLGRLVSDKGVDLLLQAVARLREKGCVPSVSIVGTGPESQALLDQCSRLGLEDQIRFLGPLKGEELAGALHRHRILVVPSRWAEPFGIVALEGIACGCAVVGSDQGGLPEAIGPCGLTFPNGDALALADRLQRLLEAPSLLAELQAGAETHLQRFHSRNVADVYLKHFRELCPGA